jgi:hypothetical protein
VVELVEPIGLIAIETAEGRELLIGVAADVQDGVRSSGDRTSFKYASVERVPRFSNE